MSAVIEDVFPVIRQATNDDIGRLVTYAKDFWDQTEYSDAVEYDLETMIENTLSIIENDVLLYAEHQGNIVGLIAIMISPFPMNKHHLSACEWGFYVSDEYRKSGLGIRLIEEAEVFLKEKNVTFFTLISLANLRPEAVGRFYEKLGYKLTESDYMKVLGGK